MKKIYCTAIALLLVGGMGTNADVFAQGTNAADKSLVKHFTSSLNEGKIINYEQDKKVRLSELDQCRNQVWMAWKTANEQFSEEPLLALKALSEGNNGKWNLPADLEPNAVMPYYYGYKGKERPQEGYPFFIYMHGSGPKEQEWATGLTICQRFDDAPSAYFIPQIPNEGSYYRWWQLSKQYAWEKLLRMSMLSGDINPNQIYMFGISEGGYGSQRLASYYADYLAAAGPMAGGEPLKNAPAENCSNIGFSLLTGAEDKGFYRDILTGYVAEAFDSLQQIKPDFFQHRIELIPGYGHAIDYSRTTPWLKKFVRNPYPAYFSWEDFEMDGRHRNGFYNLLVTERPSEERTHYEVQIEDNVVRIQVDNVHYVTTQIDPNWGIEMKFNKSYEPATTGRFTVFLNEHLVDLKKPVQLWVNGKLYFKGKLKLNLRNMVNCCMAFYDSCRLYPASIEVELK